MRDNEKDLLECARKIKDDCLRRKTECTGCVLERAGCNCNPCQWELPEPEIETTKAETSTDGDISDLTTDPEYLSTDSPAVSAATVDKPRLCEVLGVEVGEPVTVRYPSRLGGTEDISVGIDKDGVPHYETGAATAAMIIVYAINHPEAIVRAPRWDEDELNLMRYLRKLGAAYITRDRDGILCMWRGEPKYLDECTWYCGDGTRILRWAYPPEGFMPHLRPGECVSLEEVAGT